MIARLLSVLAVTLGATAATADTVKVPEQYKSIQDGIEAAKPGDTVLVQPGRYCECIHLSAGIIVKSAGDDTKGSLGLKRAENTIIDAGGASATGPGVVMNEGATLDGFTVTGVGVFDQKEYAKHEAERGENLPDERGAVGVGGEFPAVEASGLTAVVRHCIVCDNGHTGIGCVGGKGKRNASLVTKNVCHHNMGGGIGVANGATPVIDGNRCYSNLRGGIGNRNSAAVITGNECFENVRAGIGIREGAKPTVRGNRCHHNRRAGIGCRMEGTSPVIENNECYQNGMAGIGCRDGASPLIRKNRCYENELAGIGARDKAKPTISQNRCYRNNEAGIGIESGVRATISGNECFENEKAGVGQQGDVETVIEGNHIHHNKTAGIGFEKSKEGVSIVMNNKVIDNASVAVGIHGGWKVRLSGNELSRDGGLPPIVMVFKGAEATFSDNVFRGSGVAGIRTEGLVMVSGNTFVCPTLRKTGGPPQCAVWGLAGAEVTVTGNTISGWRNAVVAEKSVVTATDNKISGYWQVGMRVTRPEGAAVITGNVFQSESEHPGVTVTDGVGLIEGNRVDKVQGK